MSRMGTSIETEVDSWLPRPADVRQKIETANGHSACFRDGNALKVILAMGCASLYPKNYYVNILKLLNCKNTDQNKTKIQI